MRINGGLLRKSLIGRCTRPSEKGQAALAIILGVVLVMITVPLVADLLVTGQQAVVATSQRLYPSVAGRTGWPASISRTTSKRILTTFPR